MAYHRSNHHAFLQGDGRVVVIGGVTIESGFLATNEVYNPATKVWSTYAPMLENRGGTRDGVAEREHLCRGRGDGQPNAAHGRGPESDDAQFTSLGNMQVARNQHRANLLG